MFDYIIEFKDKNTISKLSLECVNNLNWQKYEINDRCNLLISLPKSKGEIYIFKNSIVWGKLFEKIDNISYNAEQNEKRSISVDELVKNYWGNYIALFFDNNDIKVFRDPSASINCLWYTCEETTLVFSSLDSYRKCIEHNFRIDRKYIAATLCFNRINNCYTGIKDVKSLIAGCSISLNTGKIESHWSPENFANAKNDEISIDCIEEKLRKTVIDCLTVWGNSYKSILINLSGGLDSSIVAICLKEFSKANLTALNFYSDSLAGNEVRYAKEVSEKYEINLNLFKLNNYKLNLIDKLNDFPCQHRPMKFGLGFESNDYEADVIINHKIDAIFSGCGGDALFQNNNSIFISQDYYRDKGFNGLFTTSRRVAELTDRTVWDIFIKSILNKYSKKKKYLYENRISKELICEYYVDQIDYNYLSHPWHDLFSDLNNGKKFQISGLIDSENFYTYRKSSEKVDVVHPLLSQPIIELCLTIPSYILTPNLINRGLIRSAFKEYLPESIMIRRSKCTAGNFFSELIEYNYNDICNNLLNGKLIDYQIVSKEWLDKAIKLGRIDENIKMQLFQLITTEIWLRKMC